MGTLCAENLPLTCNTQQSVVNMYHWVAEIFVRVNRLQQEAGLLCIQPGDNIKDCNSHHKSNYDVSICITNVMSVKLAGWMGFSRTQVCYAANQVTTQKTTTLITSQTMMFSVCITNAMSVSVSSALPLGFCSTCRSHGHWGWAGNIASNPCENTMRLPPHILWEGSLCGRGDPQSRSPSGCVSSRGGWQKTHQTCPRSEQRVAEVCIPTL